MTLATERRTLQRVVWYARRVTPFAPAQPAPAQHLMTPVRNRIYRDKAEGGLWTSPEGSGFGWDDWCRSEMPHWLGDRWVLTVVGEPRVLAIDSLTDLELACLRFPAPPSDPSWGFARPPGPRMDWEAVAVEYDAVWLTEAGQWATRFSEPDLYGWDCETVWWTRWMFSDVRAAER